MQPGATRLSTCNDSRSRLQGRDRAPRRCSTSKPRRRSASKELAALGWADGPNLRLEIRWSGGNVNRASVFSKELVDLQPGVILSQGTTVTAALKPETRGIAIVFGTVLAKRRAETSPMSSRSTIDTTLTGTSPANPRARAPALDKRSSSPNLPQ